MKAQRRWPFLKYARNEVRQGPWTNLRRAAMMSDGVYSWCFGDDDILIPGVLKRVIDEILSFEGGLPTLVLVGYAVLDADTLAVGSSDNEAPLRSTARFRATGSVFDRNGFAGSLCLPRIVVQRRFLVEELPSVGSSEWRSWGHGRAIVKAAASGSSLILALTGVLYRRYPSGNPSWAGGSIMAGAAEFPEMARFAMQCGFSRETIAPAWSAHTALRARLKMELLPARYPKEVRDRIDRILEATVRFPWVTLKAMKAIGIGVRLVVWNEALFGTWKIDDSDKSALEMRLNRFLGKMEK
jgi:hypothetical protein